MKHTIFILLVLLFLGCGTSKAAEPQGEFEKMFATRMYDVKEVYLDREPRPILNLKEKTITGVAIGIIIVVGIGAQFMYVPEKSACPSCIKVKNIKNSR